MDLRKAIASTRCITVLIIYLKYVFLSKTPFHLIKTKVVNKKRQTRLNNLQLHIIKLNFR